MRVQHGKPCMFAAHHRLSNLTAVIDANGLQSLDTVENTLSMHPLVDKFAAFGWDVHEVDLDYNHTEILNAFQSSGIKPKAIIGHTVKGKGVSFMEGRVDWHYKSPTADDLRKALEELSIAG